MWLPIAEGGRLTSKGTVVVTTAVVVVNSVPAGTDTDALDADNSIDATEELNTVAAITPVALTMHMARSAMRDTIFIDSSVLPLTSLQV